MSILRSPTRGAYAELAAAGTTQATAAEITADYVVVTSVSIAADGVLLPPGNLNDEVIVVNGSSSDNLKIYPRSGGKINRATTDAALEITPNTAAHFRGENDLNWAAFF